MGVAAQLREIDSGTAATLLRWCNVVCGLLGVAIAGCWHIYHAFTCSDDAAEVIEGEEDEDTAGCMGFWPRVSTTVVALYIMWVVHSCRSARAATHLWRGAWVPVAVAARCH